MWWWPNSVFLGYFEPDGLPLARVLLDTPPGGEALKELDAPAAGLVRYTELGCPRVLIADTRVDPVTQQGHCDVDNSWRVPDRVGHDFREQEDDCLTFLLGGPRIEKFSESIPGRANALWRRQQGQAQCRHVKDLPR